MKTRTTSEAVAKLDSKSTKDEALRILWQWIKEGSICRRQFQEILLACPYLSQ